LGEIVGFMETIERFLPKAAIDQVIPFGDEVMNRAARGHAVEKVACVAERDRAIHAAGALLAQVLLLHVIMELVPITDALDGGAVLRKLAEIFDEAGGFTHERKIP